MERTDVYLHNRSCPECGKKFFCYGTDQWVYKRPHNGTELYFCTWGCLRHFEARIRAEHPNRIRAIDLPKERINEIYRLKDRGYTRKDIQLETGLGRYIVNFWLDNDIREV